MDAGGQLLREDLLLLPIGAVHRGRGRRGRDGRGDRGRRVRAAVVLFGDLSLLLSIIF